MACKHLDRHAVFCKTCLRDAISITSVEQKMGAWSGKARGILLHGQCIR